MSTLLVASDFERLGLEPTVSLGLAERVSVPKGPAAGSVQEIAFATVVALLGAVPSRTLPPSGESQGVVPAVRHLVRLRVLVREPSVFLVDPEAVVARLLCLAKDAQAWWGADVLRLQGLHGLLSKSGLEGAALARALAREYRY
jgi:hypothetical protein